MNRRDQIALTPDEQRQYLDAGHTIVLGTNGLRGHPQLTAMWYVNDPDGTIWMTTFAKSQKTKNVERDPHVTLLIESGRTYPELKGLLIRGRASIDEDTEHVLDVLETVQGKYNTGVPSEGLRDVMRGQARKRVVVRVRPERVSSWDHQKLGGAY